MRIDGGKYELLDWHGTLTRSNLAHRLILETRRKFKATKLITMAYYPDGAQVLRSVRLGAQPTMDDALVRSYRNFPCTSAHSILGHPLGKSFSHTAGSMSRTC
jgi:hypothetical protein